MFLRERGHLPLEARGGIAALYDHGVSVREIADRFGCHPTTVRRWAKRYENTLEVKRQPGSGRPRKTTAAEDEMLFDAVRAKPITTAQEILRKFALTCFIFTAPYFTLAFLDVTGIDVSVHTVVRRLKSRGIRPRIAVSQDFMTDEQKLGRANFAEEYGNNDDNFWAGTGFCDEKTFGLVFNKLYYVLRLINCFTLQN